MSNSDDNDHPYEDRSPLKLPGSPSLEGLRVLVVDDNPDIIELIAFTLETYGAEVLTATSARKALQAIGQFQIDLLISDIAMPGVDGHEMIRQVRAFEKEQGRQIPAIAITAYFVEKEERSCSDGAEFQMWMQKPVELSDLVRVVAKVSGRS